MRGKPRRQRQCRSHRRITPAGAGKTERPAGDSAASRDHPRRCGENTSEEVDANERAGSPPQVRGKLDSEYASPAESGITPAGAGKTEFIEHSRCIAEDHPRRCGENPLMFLSSLHPTGSPPQVRGKPKLADSARAAVGITPAGAGKTFNPESVGGIEEDHPRRCGENLWIRFCRFQCPGSPPQVRGKLLERAVKEMSGRITPAGAGKTLTKWSTAVWNRDHPRRCGENIMAYNLDPRNTGSPPQVRGKLLGLPNAYFRTRITPAGAGKTIAGQFFNRLPKDHPRRCGENTPTHSPHASAPGSPPQVRGKPGLRPLCRHSRRITPAGAGKTDTDNCAPD